MPTSTEFFAELKKAEQEYVVTALRTIFSLGGGITLLIFEYIQEKSHTQNNEVSGYIGVFFLFLGLSYYSKQSEKDAAVTVLRNHYNHSLHETLAPSPQDKG